VVVGCGGHRRAVVAGLPYLHQSLLGAWPPLEGLHVTVVDGDWRFHPPTCVCAGFLPRSEIGLNKAIAFINRLNLFWGLKWDAVPAHSAHGTQSSAAILAVTSCSHG